MEKVKSIEEITKWLEDHLDPERYSHSLGTAETARELAKKYGENLEKAYLAGLIHDCAKCFVKERLKEIIEENLDIDPCEMLNYKTYHAPVGAWFAQKEFGIKDEEILNALRSHTLGDLNMTLLQKIVFLADKIEPNTRSENFREPIEEKLEEENGLNKAIFECFRETIKSLAKRRLKICQKTIDIYNKYLDILAE